MISVNALRRLFAPRILPKEDIYELFDGISMLHKEYDLHTVSVCSLNLVMKSLFADIPGSFIEILLPIDDRELIIKPRIVTDPELGRNVRNSASVEGFENLPYGSRLFSCINDHCHHKKGLSSSAPSFSG